jgi:hypothetical protein
MVATTAFYQGLKIVLLDKSVPGLCKQGGRVKEQSKSARKGIMQQNIGKWAVWPSFEKFF